MSAELRGAEELKRTLESIGAGSIKEAAMALQMEAIAVAKQSLNNTPKDTGNLRGSHRVTKAEIVDGNIKATIQVGGPAKGGGGGKAYAMDATNEDPVGYALVVHEHPSSHSPRSWAGGVHFTQGGPKFLERAVHEAAKDWTVRLAKRIDLNRAKRGR